MNDMDGVFLYIFVACFVCLLFGALVGLTFAPECAGNVVYVTDCVNLSRGFVGGARVMESDGILVVENLSMLEMFRE